MNTIVAVYDTKPYDRESLARAEGAETIDWRFLDFRLGLDTAYVATGAQAVCVFVNDDASRAVLEKLAGLGVGLLALRCTGFNKVDLSAAKELGLPVTRVPTYSPYSVAEHTVALVLALNRKLHRAFNRVRELNFSLGGLEGFDLHGKTAGTSITGSRPDRRGLIRTTCDGLAFYQGPDDVDEAIGFVLPDGSFELARHLIGNQERAAFDYWGVAKMRWDGQRWVELQRVQLAVSVRRPEQEHND